MKATYKITYFLIAAALLAGINISCNKIGDFGTTNVNPNGSSTVATSAFIASVQSRLFSAETQGGFFAQYFSQPTYPVASRYATPQFNSVGIYAGVLQDCKIIIDRNTNAATMAAAAESGSNVNQIAIARIMKAYIFWDVTDKWGDMPYSEALLGTANLTPKYDKQEDIYKDMIKELTEANAQFDAAGVYVNGDLIYGYNGLALVPANAVLAPVQIAKWKKFSNSLRMLMSLRLSKRYPNAGEYAATQFTAAVNNAAGHITTNADNFQLNYLGGSIALNNPWNSVGNSSDLGESQTMTDALTGFGDTRISISGSNSTGVPYGSNLPANTAITYAKILSAPFKTTTGMVVIIPASAVAENPDPATVKAAIGTFNSLSKAEKKDKIRDLKKELKVFKAAKKAGNAPSTNTVLLVILAILLPPLAVYLHEGAINKKFWISLLLTLLFFVPGVIYALIVVLGD